MHLSSWLKEAQDSFLYASLILFPNFRVAQMDAHLIKQTQQVWTKKH